MERDPAARLAREIEHHRRIAGRAEEVWTWDTPAGRRRADRRCELLREATALGPGMRALELGCGTGVFLERMAACGARIRGLDLSLDLLARAHARVRTRPNLSLACGNAEALPFPDGCFDAVYGSSILHHLDLERSLRELFRVLRPGGRAAFAEPNALNPQVVVMFHFGPTKEHFGVSPDEMAFSRFRAARALRAAGFEDVRATPFDFLHPSLKGPWIERASRLGRALERLPLVREIAGSFLMAGRRPSP